jgi:D-alanyl-D-alanine carboxypeptidase/D-alanyl-D-alanine-endopeptidase (penicillin-binding protein 4)
MDVTTGRMLVSHGQGDYNIASNVKLVTTAAALALLGPEYRWRTTLYVDVPAWTGGDTVRGHLFFHATGDPTLDEPALASMAEALRRLGVKKIEGSLVVDDTFFDAKVVPPAFDQKKEDSPFRAPVGAAALNYNAVAVMIQPGPASGAPARVLAAPDGDYVQIVNQVVTVTEGRTRVSVTSKVPPGKPARLQLTVSGTIRIDEGERYVRKRIDDPVEYLGAAFRSELADHGIKLTGKRVMRLPVPKTARALTSRSSEPLGVLVRDVNKSSNNMMAETLLKTLAAEKAGVPGTWEAGQKLVHEWLAVSAALGPSGWRYDNGSGLYDSNRFTPAQIAGVLRAAWLDFRIAPDFVASLAIAGADGTIRSRMIGSPAERHVRAKTGTLRMVSCLAGYAQGGPAAVAAGRGPLAFAVFANDIPEKVAGSGKAARSLQDEIASALVLYLDGR